MQKAEKEKIKKNSLQKHRIILDDGRYLIFYTFDNSPELQKKFNKNTDKIGNKENV